MPHPFEISFDVTLPATPDQVWDAIATGPGLDSWFMGRNDVEPREGGAATMDTGGSREDAVVTAYDPPHRFATRTTPGPDGRYMAFEYLIEADHGSTVLRVVHSGMLGDDWQDEYDALRRGWPLHLDTLREYLAHFPGRHGVPAFAFAAVPGRSADELRAALTHGLALSDGVTVGARARATPDGAPALDGEITWAEADRLKVRTADGLYSFFLAPGLALMFHHLFAPATPDAADAAWQRWLTDTLVSTV
ncbi:SRPBCC family protein [Xylanimonas sp. McL0601]|uniref:SRPBCC family protein n=1 Tax=Xylanimonas sp. McL0601 TaxID=3414739 RepID=UPI003CF44354